MDPESILDELLRRNIVTTSSTTDEVSLSASFDEAVARERTAVEAAESPRTYLAAAIDDADTIDVLCSIADDTAFLARYCALADRAPGLSSRAAVRATVVLDHFRGHPPKSSGAPDGFLPVRGDRLETLIRLSERAVIYAWLTDCPTCELMQEELADVLGDAPDVSRFAVYGPNWAEELRAVDVDGGPTTLFVLDGRIDARLHGAHYPKTIASEVKTLRKLSTS